MSNVPVSEEAEKKMRKSHWPCQEQAQELHGGRVAIVKS